MKRQLTLDNNNNNAEIGNEGNTTIFNEQISFKGLDALILCHFDQGDELDEERNEIVFNECYKVLVKNRMKEKH